MDGGTKGGNKTEEGASSKRWQNSKAKLANSIVAFILRRHQGQAICVGDRAQPAERDGRVAPEEAPVEASRANRGGTAAGERTKRRQGGGVFTMCSYQ